MSDPPVGFCKSCGARVVWGITSAGKRMPVDVDPAANGNVSLRWIAAGRHYAIDVLGGEVLAKAREEDETPLHLSHFATCPKAERHRRR